MEKHILRSENPNGARIEILRNLSVDEVFKERYWAMMFLPMVNIPEIELWLYYSLDSRISYNEN